MASIEFIQSRIEGAEKKVDSLKKKIERIKKAEASGWENNPYYYDERDLKYALRDLENAEKSLEDYKAKLASEIEKDASRDVPAILEFLDKWKERVIGIYSGVIHEYFELKDEVAKAYRVCPTYFFYKREEDQSEEYKKYNGLKREFQGKVNGYYEKYIDERGRERERKVRDGEWEFAKMYFLGNEEESVARVVKDVEQEAKRKYDFIIERVNAICGAIVDAGGLTVGNKGDLNGIIVGERGNASVKTVGAGGYNIQCWHMRTLVHKAK